VLLTRRRVREHGRGKEERRAGGGKEDIPFPYIFF